MDIPAKFGIPISPQSPDTGQSSGVRISDFKNSGQIFYNQKLS